MILCGTASASPDVVLTSVNTQNNVSPGSTVTINDTVTNTGTKTETGLHVGYYIQDEYAVVKKPANQRNASIYGDTVVWSDYRYNRAEGDIYIKNVKTGIDKVIGNDTADEINPAVYGDVVVWQKYTGGYWNIIGYHVPSRDELVILNKTPANQENPSICQDKIVWQQKDGAYWNIYLYDFPITGDDAMPTDKWTTQITTGNVNHINPYVSENYIVWQQDDGSGNNWHICAYDLSTGKIIQVPTASGNQENASIYGNNVVWQQYNTTGKNWDIYMYDLSKGDLYSTPITTNTADQINPAIYGDKIVWQDNRNNNWDIYMYDLTLGIERQLTTDNGNQIDPAIYDNKVVWTDDRNGNEDIYIIDNITLAPEYTRYISSLAPNTSNSVPTNITLPSDLKTNVNYYIIAVVEDASGNIISTKMSSTPMIVPDIDLTIPSISGPTTVQSGKSIIIVNTVKNTGSQNSNPFRIQFYLSNDSTITTSDTPIGNLIVSTGLKQGTSNTFYTTVTLPSNLALGSYYIGAIIDPDNNVTETNELNNIGTSLTSINICAPDLIDTSIITGSTTYKKGDIINIQNTVKNQGEGTSGGFYVKFYLSNDSTITTSDAYLGDTYITEGLQAGESRTTVTPVTLQYDLAGNYYIGAIVDPDNNVTETNELNNIGTSLALINIWAPDLIDTSIITGSTTYKKGDQLIIQNTVKNQGNTAATGFYVKFYLSSYNGSSDIYLGQQYISGLQAGASTTTYTPVTLPYTVGNYYIKAVVDPDNNVLETNELNNIAYPYTISICAPDLAATSITTGAISYKKGSKITIKNTVKNQGSAASGGFYVKFYLSKNSSYKTSSDIYLGKRYVSSLRAGSSNKATTYLKIPKTVKKGHYSCKMVIYPVNSSADSKTSDKIICSRIWLDIH